MKFAILLVLVIVAIVITSVFTRYKNLQKLKRNLEKNFGRVPARKYDEYIMESIASHWNYKRSHEVIPRYVDDLTWNDLNMDNVYMRINNSCSSVGEEYLYSTLRVFNFDKGSLTKFEQVISFFSKNPGERTKTQFELSRLGKVAANGAIDFFTNTKEKALKYHFIYPILSISTLLSILSIIPLGSYGAILIIAIAITNLFVYFKTKLSVEVELTSIRYISALILCAEKLSKLKSDNLSQYTLRLSELHNPLHKISKLAGVIISKSSSDIDILEYVKIVFLLDFVVYNRMISLIEKHAKECYEIYCTLGFLDTAISIASYRKSLKYYSTPDFIDTDEIQMQEIVHPLLSKPVSNSLVFSKSALITGSNASGKSTFVKAVAINAIFSQTIHTCLAKSFKMKPAFVVTSMAINDNVENGDSYYIAEIKSLKRILDKLDERIRCLCFVDEILKGTNTIERIAASAAVLDFLSTKNCVAIIATHDIELTEIVEESYDNFHFQEHISDNGIDFDYKIYAGRATTKNAIRLLEFMHYHPAIISAANKMAADFEANHSWSKL
jgi:Mismatch repair ATPase (MutS family)